MNKFPLQPEALDAAELAAASWILRRQKGLSRTETQELDQWLAASPGHARMLAEMERTAGLLDALPKAPRAEVITFPQAREPARRRGVVLRAAVACAVLLAAGGTAWWQVVRVRPAYAQSAETQVGGMQKLALPDGSVVRLNTNSAVEVSYVATERRVRLVRGEAYFTVAKDKSRPFWVQAGPLAVRAVGTEFNVRLGSDRVNVLVTEGKVRVVEDENSGPAPHTESAGSMLTQGQLAQISLAGDSAQPTSAVVITAVEPRQMKNTVAWQEGRLAFFDIPLAEVVAEFNRYNAHRIVIADPVLAARLFGGSFASHRVEPLLEVLEQSFGVVSEERGGETVLRLAK